jgi:hypothetical protein
MSRTTKINPKLPEFLETGGGVQKIMSHLDELHGKELSAMLARHEYELHSLKRKHADQKSSSMSKLVKPTKAKVRTNKSSR